MRLVSLAFAVLTIAVVEDAAERAEREHRELSARQAAEAKEQDEATRARQAEVAAKSEQHAQQAKASKHEAKAAETESNFDDAPQAGSKKRKRKAEPKAAAQAKSPPTYKRPRTRSQQLIKPDDDEVQAQLPSEPQQDVVMAVAVAPKQPPPEEPAPSAEASKFALLPTPPAKQPTRQWPVLHTTVKCLLELAVRVHSSPATSWADGAQFPVLARPEGFV